MPAEPEKLRSVHLLQVVVLVFSVHVLSLAGIVTDGGATGAETGRLVKLISIASSVGDPDKAGILKQVIGTQRWGQVFSRQPWPLLPH